MAMAPSPRRSEALVVTRLGCLRAAALGANDGLLSTLMIGVAGATPSHDAIVDETRTDPSVAARAQNAPDLEPAEEYRQALKDTRTADIEVLQARYPADAVGLLTTATVDGFADILKMFTTRSRALSAPGKVLARHLNRQFAGTGYLLIYRAN